jgi:hypothetical protein
MSGRGLASGAGAPCAIVWRGYPFLLYLLKIGKEIKNHYQVGSGQTGAGDGPKNSASLYVCLSG